MPKHQISDKREQQKMGATATLRTRGPEVETPSERVPARLNIFLSEKAREDLRVVAGIRKTTLTEVVRLGLALVKLAVEEGLQGHKLAITDANGKVLKEVLLPS